MEKAKQIMDLFVLLFMKAQGEMEPRNPWKYMTRGRKEDNSPFVMLTWQQGEDTGEIELSATWGEEPRNGLIELLSHMEDLSLMPTEDFAEYAKLIPQIDPFGFQCDLRTLSQYMRMCHAQQEIDEALSKADSAYDWKYTFYHEDPGATNTCVELDPLDEPREGEGIVITVDYDIYGDVYDPVESFLEHLEKWIREFQPKEAAEEIQEDLTRINGIPQPMDSLLRYATDIHQKAKALYEDLKV